MNLRYRLERAPPANCGGPPSVSTSHAPWARPGPGYMTSRPPRPPPLTFGGGGRWPVAV